MPTRRVNLRIDEDTYLAFEKVADFFQRSVAAMIREACDTLVPTMHQLGAMVDQAKAGDAEAAQRVLNAMLDGYAHELVLAREVINAPNHGDEEVEESAGASNTAL